MPRIPAQDRVLTRETAAGAASAMRDAEIRDDERRRGRISESDSLSMRDGEGAAKGRPGCRGLPDLEYIQSQSIEGNTGILTYLQHLQVRNNTLVYVHDERNGEIKTMGDEMSDDWVRDDEMNDGKVAD